MQLKALHSKVMVIYIQKFEILSIKEQKGRETKDQVKVGKQGRPPIPADILMDI